MAPQDGLSALAFPHAAPPAPGTTIEVAPGIHWLRMPLPFALNHINLWLLKDGEGWTIVDTGLANDGTRALWDEVFARTLGDRPVTRVIVTHFHPDHIGLAGWLCARWQVPLDITEKEWLYARMLKGDTDDVAFAAEQRPFYRAAGLTPDQVEMCSPGNPYWQRVSDVPRGFRRLVDGAALTIDGRTWRIVVGRGHAPEHACLYCPALDVLISGDQILPKITPNVSLWPNEPQGDPLSLYISSLEKIRATVPASAFVLPSHNLPFRGLETRIDQMHQHHADRLAEVEAACASPQTGAQIVPVLFRRSLDGHQLTFAIGEALAHLSHLVAVGRLAQTTRDDGVHLYVRRIAG